MNYLISSASRLCDSETLELFKELFALHGALGGQSIKIGQREVDDFSDLDKLRLIPIVFGLIPIRALSRENLIDPILPSIKDHLRNLQIRQDDETLNSILKSISEQFCKAKTQPKTKFSIGRVKTAFRHVYQTLLENQSCRCAICGVEFEETPQDNNDAETLDHVLPWYLVGDVLDGSNWQILCKRCNAGKEELISTLQHPESLNWIYSKSKDLTTFINNQITLQARYIVLSQRRCCEEAGCHAEPRESHLLVVQKISSGLCIADNLGVFCIKHSRRYRVQGY